MKTFAAPTPTGTTLPVIEVRTWVKRAMLAMQVAGERYQLRHLDARQLDDLGLTKTDAAQESTRTFWDLPAGR